jgi:hypothetical protein
MLPSVPGFPPQSARAIDSLIPLARSAESFLIIAGAEIFVEGREIAVHPSPLPCFLEVLILKDFKSFELEVLILIDFKSLFPEVLILVELKSRRINEMREVENLLEVLIPEGLSGAKCINGWI